MNTAIGEYGKRLGQTATALNTDSFEFCRAYYQLCMYPEHQAEAIALHCVAHYQTARELLALINARDHVTVGTTTNIDDCVIYLVKQIKENHRKEFGIELEWPPQSQALERRDEMNAMKLANALKEQGRHIASLRQGFGASDAIQSLESRIGEHERLRAVYWASRAVLRYSGIDKEKTAAAVDKLRDAIDSVMSMDSGLEI